MRHAGTVLALLVVLAGCNAPLGPAETLSPDTTRTPTTTLTAAPTGTPAPDPGDVGLAADGVVDPLALARAHETRLAERSYTLRESVRVRGPNGTVLVDNRKTVRVAPGGDTYVWNATGEAASRAPVWLARTFRQVPSERAYSNETTTTVVLVYGGERHAISYPERGSRETQFLGTGRSLTGEPLVRRVFVAIDTRVTGVGRQDGVVSYELAATESPHSYVPARAPALDVVDVSLAATVERSGLVRRLALRYTLVRNGTRFDVTRLLAVEAVGSTAVERPAWLDSSGRTGAAANGSANGSAGFAGSASPPAAFDRTGAARAAVRPAGTTP